MPGERLRGRRGGGPELIRISWRDVPSQINARAGGETMQHLLPRRFQKGRERKLEPAGVRLAHDFVENAFLRVQVATVVRAEGPGFLEADSILNSGCAGFLNGQRVDRRLE